MYRCNAWRLSAKSLVKISVGDSEAVGIAVLSVSSYGTPSRGCTATLTTRMGDFPLPGVVCTAAGPMRGQREAAAFKMIPIRSGSLKRLIAAALPVPCLWNVAWGGQPSAATVVALDPGVTAGVG